MLTLQIAIISVLATGIFVYTPWRLSNLFTLQRGWLLYLGVIFVVVLGLTSLSLVSEYTSNAIDVVYLVSTAFMGFLFYLFMSLLVMELVMPIMKLSKQKAGTIVLALAFTISSYGIWNAYRFDINEVEVSMKGLAEPVTVAVLADIQVGGHRGSSWLARAVKAANALEPDFVLIPGDLVDSNTAVNREKLASLKNLKAPSYFVTGNHDTYVKEQKLKDILNELNVTVLENRVVTTPGNLQLVGLAFMNPDEDTFDLHPSEDTDTIKSILPTLPVAPDIPTIVMHHSPVGEHYVDIAGADLYVAGHTHGGGQVWPATVIACKVFYNYCGGLYEFQKLQIFVSQGLGTFTLPMRVGTKNDLDVLRLIPAQT